RPEDVGGTTPVVGADGRGGRRKQDTASLLPPRSDRPAQFGGTGGQPHQTHRGQQECLPPAPRLPGVWAPSGKYRRAVARVSLALHALSRRSWQQGASRAGGPHTTRVLPRQGFPGLGRTTLLPSTVTRCLPGSQALLSSFGGAWEPGDLSFPAFYFVAFC